MSDRILKKVDSYEISQNTGKALSILIFSMLSAGISGIAIDRTSNNLFSFLDKKDLCHLVICASSLIFIGCGWQLIQMVKHRPVSVLIEKENSAPNLKKSETSEQAALPNKITHNEIPGNGARALGTFILSTISASILGIALDRTKNSLFPFLDKSNNRPLVIVMSAMVLIACAINLLSLFDYRPETYYTPANVTKAAGQAR